MIRPRNKAKASWKQIGRIHLAWLERNRPGCSFFARRGRCKRGRWRSSHGYAPVRDDCDKFSFRDVVWIPFSAV